MTQSDRQSSIRKGKPITEYGLTFYPIMMSDYENYLAVKDSIAVRISTLPVRYVSLDLVSATWALEMDAIRQQTPSVGLFQRIILLILMSIRSGRDFETVIREDIHTDIENEQIKITSISFWQNGKEIRLTPYQLSTNCRQLIADQNGIELPDETENVDLVRDLDEKNQNAEHTKIKFNIVDMISSVAYLSHCRERDIDEWTVCEFERRRRAIDRDKKYTLYSTAELGGMVKFSHGNPAPSWCFDTVDDSFGTTALSQIGKNLGSSTGVTNPE